MPPPNLVSLFRIIEFPPYSGTQDLPDNATMLRDFGIAEGILRGRDPRHPAIHRTRALDYLVVKVLSPLAAN